VANLHHLTGHYPGRTKRNFQKRINDHIGNSDKKGDYCSIAFRLARKKVKQFEKANYKKGFREMAMKNPEFKKVYNLQKERVCKMKVQYVVEKDPLTQALLEIYAQVESNCILKDFDTH